MIKLRILRCGDYPRLSRWAQCNHRAHHKKEAGESVRNVKKGAEVRERDLKLLCRWLGGRDHRPGSAGSLKKLHKAEALEPPEGTSLADTSILAK